MKLRINENGNLVILRGKEWKDQLCPVCSGIEDNELVVCCGDWCPRFKEPHLTNPKTVLLRICDGTTFDIAVDDFEDLRSDEFENYRKVVK